MRTKKSTSFWASFVSILAVYFVTLIIAPAVAEGIGSTVVIALAVAGGIFQAANVADNGVKGKFYRPELDARDVPCD